MAIRFHAHAQSRLKERGTNEEEVKTAVSAGEQFQAKYGRIGFRRNFKFDGLWQGKRYENKQVEVYAVDEFGDWLVITVIVKFF